MLLCACISSACCANDLPKWPLRNGDFSTHQAGVQPTDWKAVVIGGKHTFRIDPFYKYFIRPPFLAIIDVTEKGREYLRPVSSAVIETTETGSACYRQTVLLTQGTYRLSAEVSGTEGAYARLDRRSGAFRSSSEATGIDPEWKRIFLEFPTPSGDTTVDLVAVCSAGQNVAFRNVKLEIQELESAPVLQENGAQIGGIVLPEDPALAEQYAAYELQRCVWRMTGLVPGLEGRDRTFSGGRIHVGGAVSGEAKQALDPLESSDAYVTGSYGNDTVLAGNSDAATLYAVYDYLGQQGCRWVVPGNLGEIIPVRESLVTCVNKTESPDYDGRGIMQFGQDFFPGGDGGEKGLLHINLDDYLDWMLRIRMNAFNVGDIVQVYLDFGAHRGHGWFREYGHAYGFHVAPAERYFDSHPEWYPLVNGKRTPYIHNFPGVPEGWPNQLCVSSKSLRDYTVSLVLDYFTHNPSAKVFPLSPMDNTWCCECDECKKLDPPGIDWSKHASELQVKGMTDRCLNYANEVADRVSKVYPDRYIEMFAYGQTLEPPRREQVHENVVILYANLSGGRGNGPLGVSIMEPDNPIWKTWREKLDDWKKAGGRLAYYAYMEWEHHDVPLFWFFNESDTLKHLNRNWDCRIFQPETENNVFSSPMLYHVIARTLWDVDTDYVPVVRDLCDAFYAPIGAEMYAYNMMMDAEVRKSTAWEKPDWRPNLQVDIPLEALVRGRQMLEAAAENVESDDVLSRRLAYARFAHSCLTYVAAQHQETKTRATRDIARHAFDSANAIRSRYTIMVKAATARLLSGFSYPPVAE